MSSSPSTTGTTKAAPSTSTTPHCNDVVLGRGNGVAKWPGNVLFRSIIRQHRQIYQGSIKHMKMPIAQRVMDIIVHENGGRFLTVHDDKTNVSPTYQSVTKTRALEKISQALREKIDDPADGETCRTVSNTIILVKKMKQAKVAPNACSNNMTKKTVAEAVKASANTKTKSAGSTTSPIKNRSTLRSKKMVLPTRKERRRGGSGVGSPSRVVHPTFRQLTEAAATKIKQEEEEKSDADEVPMSVRASGDLNKSDGTPVASPPTHSHGTRSTKQPTVPSGTVFKSTTKSKKTVARRSKQEVPPKKMLSKKFRSGISKSIHKSDRVVPIAPFPTPPVVVSELETPICAAIVEPAKRNMTPLPRSQPRPPVVSPVSHEDVTTTRDRQDSSTTAATKVCGTNDKIEWDSIDLDTCALATMNTTINYSLGSSSSLLSMFDGNSTTLPYSPHSSGNRPVAVDAGFTSMPQRPLCSSSMPQVVTDSSDLIQEAGTVDQVQPQNGSSSVNDDVPTATVYMDSTVTAALDVYALLPPHLQQFFCRLFPEIDGHVNGASCSSQQTAAVPAKGTTTVGLPPRSRSINDDNHMLMEEIDDLSLVFDPADSVPPAPIDPLRFFHGEDEGDANGGSVNADLDPVDIWDF